MAVSESRGRWWFEISSYRWNRSRIQLLRNPWEGDGVPYPDSNTSRSGPTNPVSAPPPRPCSPQLSSASDPAAVSLSAPHHVWAMQPERLLSGLDIQPVHSSLQERITPNAPTRILFQTYVANVWSTHYPWVFFSFFFKVKPTKPKILWILPKCILWRCNFACPSIIKSCAIKILQMSFWGEKMMFLFPVLQEACPHIRNTKLVYIEAQIRHLGKFAFSNHREMKELLWMVRYPATLC